MRRINLLDAHIMERGILFTIAIVETTSGGSCVLVYVIMRCMRHARVGLQLFRKGLRKASIEIDLYTLVDVSRIVQQEGNIRTS